MKRIAFILKYQHCLALHWNNAEFLWNCTSSEISCSKFNSVFSNQINVLFSFFSFSPKVDDISHLRGFEVLLVFLAVMFLGCQKHEMRYVTRHNI